MYSSLPTTIILLLSAWCTAVAAGLNVPAIVLTARQASASTDPQCINYSRTANLSTIALNSTYRSAFLQASPDGTMDNQFMLTAASKAVISLISDQNLNQACGNLTAIALTEAERNFSIGIVAQFSGVSPNPQAISAGIYVLAVSIGSMCVFFALSQFI